MHQFPAQVLGALSHALDVNEGEPRGHSERTAALARRLATRLGLAPDEVEQVGLAALMKDAGCSSNAADITALYGNDDAAIKRDRKLIDHRRTLVSLGHLLRLTAPGGTPAAKLRRLRALVEHGSEGATALIARRCDRGAKAAETVGLGPAVQQAIRELDEHYNGAGQPLGLQGDAISLFGRILCLASTLEVFWASEGALAAIAVAEERSGRWFDPELVAHVRAAGPALFDRLGDAETITGVATGPSPMVDADTLDAVAVAFGTIIDAKSPYTAAHSSGVAEIAVGLGSALGLDGERLRQLHRAGLLHDIGKLAVSNLILDKPGRLDADEWAVMRRHPEIGQSILGRVDALTDAAWMAAVHHERLDGSGYFVGLDASRLSTAARIIAVADVAEALTADRPYRAGLGLDEVDAILRREAGARLDGDVVEAVGGVLRARQRPVVSLLRAA